MPLYLVRWPWLTASLVSARDEEDLLDTLDQVEDSEGATWSVYRGPVWIDFEVPAKYRIDEKAPDEPLRPDEIVVEDVEKVEIGEFAVSRPGYDHTSEMHEQITNKAFPALYKVLYSGENEPTDDEVKAAVHAELERLVHADWRRAARSKRTDRIAEIETQMRAPVRQIENMLRRTGQIGPPEERPASAKVRPLRKLRSKPKSE